jgi:malonyl CoA-acyl carrier protein transacylase
MATLPKATRDRPAMAGYSVGELATFCAAGVFDAEAAERL